MSLQKFIEDKQSEILFYGIFVCLWKFHWWVSNLFIRFWSNSININHRADAQEMCFGWIEVMNLLAGQRSRFAKSMEVLIIARQRTSSNEVCCYWLRFGLWMTFDSDKGLLPQPYWESEGVCSTRKLGTNYPLRLYFTESTPVVNPIYTLKYSASSMVTSYPKFSCLFWAASPSLTWLLFVLLSILVIIYFLAFYYNPFCNLTFY